MSEFVIIIASGVVVCPGTYHSCNSKAHVCLIESEPRNLDLLHYNSTQLECIIITVIVFCLTTRLSANV
jgi:hypothetical protein